MKKLAELNQAQLNRLPLARNAAVAALRDRMESVVEAAAERGIELRKGGTSRSSRHSVAYIYANEERIWECVVRASGYWQPVSGRSLAQLLDAIEAVQVA